MGPLAVFYYMYGLFLVTTQAAEFNITFVRDDEGSFMTCDFSFQTGDITPKSLLVVRRNKISNSDFYTVGLEVSNDNTIEIDKVQDIYRDTDVEFQSYQRIYPSKRITSIGLSLSLSYYYGYQNDYIISCAAVYSKFGASHIANRDLEFKGAAPEMEESPTMSASDIILLIVLVWILILLTVFIWICCVIDQGKLKKLSVEKKSLEMELARLRGEQEGGPADQEGGPADPSDLTVQQQPAAAPTPNTDEEIADFSTHCCNINCY